MQVGEERQLVAHVFPTNATNKDVIWSTDNETVISITEDGVITAVNEGTATVSAVPADAPNSGISDTRSIIVSVPDGNVEVEEIWSGSMPFGRWVGPVIRPTGYTNDDTPMRLDFTAVSDFDYLVFEYSGANRLRLLFTDDGWSNELSAVISPSEGSESGQLAKFSSQDIINTMNDNVSLRNSNMILFIMDDVTVKRVFTLRHI
jgi:hypothetical protein